jgi:hypothetical protein
MRGSSATDLIRHAHPRHHILPEHFRKNGYFHGAAGQTFPHAHRFNGT